MSPSSREPPARGAFLRALGALLLFVLPLGYVATLAAVVVHEVLGHGLAAVASGGEFRGFFIEPDGHGRAFTGGRGSRVAVLAAGCVVEYVVGLALLFSASRMRRRPLAGLVLLLPAVTCIEDAAPYALWGCIYARGSADFARLVSEDGSEGLRVALCVAWGLAYAAGAWAWVHVAVGWVDARLGPLRGRRAAFVFAACVAVAAAFWALYDWDQVIPGAGTTPAVVGVVLEAALLAWTIRRSRHEESVAIPPGAWRPAIALAWAGSAALVTIILVAFRDRGP